jgi:hypothetical protein
LGPSGSEYHTLKRFCRTNHPFSVGVDESIRQDIEEIRRWSFLPAKAQVVGYALDIETGAMREVVS